MFSFFPIVFLNFLNNSTIHWKQTANFAETSRRCSSDKEHRLQPNSSSVIDALRAAVNCQARGGGCIALHALCAYFQPTSLSFCLDETCPVYGNQTFHPIMTFPPMSKAILKLLSYGVDQDHIKNGPHTKMDMNSFESSTISGQPDAVWFETTMLNICHGALSWNHRLKIRILWILKIPEIHKFKKNSFSKLRHYLQTLPCRKMHAELSRVVKYFAVDVYYHL